MNYFLQGKINLDSYSQSGPASGDTPGGRDLYCGGGGGGCIFHQTIYSGTQPDPRQSKFGVKVLYTGDIMIVRKIWDNIKHQYQIYNTLVYSILEVEANIISKYNNYRSSNEKLFDDQNISRFGLGAGEKCIASHFNANT